MHRAAGLVGAVYLRFVQATSSVLVWDAPWSLSVRQSLAPCIYAFWHNKQVYLAVHHKHEGVAVMVSRSRDGEYIAQVMQSLGLKPVRGSSSKGGDSALREMVRILESGGHVGFTPDGPRGPLHTVHGGVVLAAQTTGLPVIATTYIAERRAEFRSWDRFILPLPFGRVLVAHGQPFTIGKEIELDAAKKMIQDALIENERRAEAVLANAPSWTAEQMAGLAFFIYGAVATLFAPFVALGAAIVFGFKRGTRFVNERFSAAAPPVAFTSPLWFHSASVGEWQALKPVLRELRAALGDKPVPFVITVNTPEARVLVAKEAPDAWVRMIPLDVPWRIGIWCRRLKPRALIIVETELWPATILAAARRHIPIFVINGRLSEKSFRRWLVVKPLIRHLLFKLSGVIARGPEDASRFQQLGLAAERVQAFGNTKVDNLEMAEKSPLLMSSIPVLVGGSTWPGEEQLLMSVLLAATPRKLRLILAPRRLERVDEICSQLKAAQLSFSRYSDIKSGAAWTANVLVVDTLGDLKNLYSSAQLAFVGGSVFPHGGQNPLEPAAAGLPVVFGPSMSNFRSEAVGLVAAGAAVRGADAEQVRKHLTELAQNEPRRLELGVAAGIFIERQRGASARTAQRLCELLRNT